MITTQVIEKLKEFKGYDYLLDYYAGVEKAEDKESIFYRDYTVNLELFICMIENQDVDIIPSIINNMLCPAVSNTGVSVEVKEYLAKLKRESERMNKSITSHGSKFDTGEWFDKALTLLNSLYDTYKNYNSDLEEIVKYDAKIISDEINNHRLNDIADLLVEPLYKILSKEYCFTEIMIIMQYFFSDTFNAGIGSRANILTNLSHLTKDDLEIDFTSPIDYDSTNMYDLETMEKTKENVLKMLKYLKKVLTEYENIESNSLYLKVVSSDIKELSIEDCNDIYATRKTIIKDLMTSLIILNYLTVELDSSTYLYSILEDKSYV